MGAGIVCGSTGVGGEGGNVSRVEREHGGGQLPPLFSFAVQHVTIASPTSKMEDYCLLLASRCSRAELLETYLKSESVVV